jgi:hypothetical protein
MERYERMIAFNELEITEEKAATVYFKVYFPGVRLEGLSKITKTLSQDSRRTGLDSDR